MNCDLDSNFRKVSSVRRGKHVLMVRTNVRVGASGSCDADKNYCLFQCAKHGERHSCDETCMRNWRNCTGIRM